MRQLLIASLVFVASSATFAQQPGDPPLGDLAKKVEADRTTGKKAGRKFTNADLGQPEAASDAASPAVGIASASAGKPAASEPVVQQGESKVTAEPGATQPEEHWRGRADFIRTEAARAHARYEQLVGDAAASANPSARSSNAQEKQRIQQMLDGLAKQWDRLEESARMAKISLDWIGARPNFSL